MLSLLPRELRELLAEYVQPHLRLIVNEHVHLFLSEPCFSLVCRCIKCWDPPTPIADVPLIHSTGQVILRYKPDNLTLHLLGAASVNLNLTEQNAIRRALGRSPLTSAKLTLDSYVTNVEVSVCLNAKDIIYITVSLENSTCKLSCVFSYSFSGDLCGISRTENGIVLSSQKMRLTLNSELSSVLVSRLCVCSSLPDMLEDLIRV